MQRLPAIADGEGAVCTRCNSLLRRAATDSVAFARANALAASLLFLLALALPLVGLEVVGRSAISTVFSGPEQLRDHGMPILALVVVALLLLVPAAKLALEVVVLFGMLARRPPRAVAWLFGWLEWVSPWSMIEVFLLACFVAYTRLEALAHVDVAPAALALGGVTLCTVATDATLDHEAVWQALDRGSPHADDPTSGAPPGTGCDTCGAVVGTRVGLRCPRCLHRVFLRRPGAIQRAWAQLVAAAILYVPANLLPVMSTERMGKGGPTTILHGVGELVDADLWPLAILVFLASIVVPVLKLGSLGAMLVLTHLRSSWRLVGRTRAYRFVRVIGRWSMLDVFALGVLVGVVRFGHIAQVRPGGGAAAFCAVVVLTMGATEAFDPRLMWDAVARGQPEEVATHARA